MMTSKKKLAQKHLSLLQLAKQLLNIFRVCRMPKVSPSQIDLFKKSVQGSRLEGLMEKSHIPAFHPYQIPECTKKRKYM